MEPILKLGCKPAKRDARNFRMPELLITAKRPAARYDFDKENPGRTLQMWGNDVHGDCVVCGTGNDVTCKEKVEQGSFLNITTEQVLAQYFKESGGEDSGLYMLDHMNVWRKDGVALGGGIYKIQAFAEVTPQNITEVKRTVAANIGIQLGLAMPDNWAVEWNKGKPWTDISGEPNEYNGHCVYAIAYDPKYLYVNSWGKRRGMAWPWLKKFCTEAYGAVDARNTNIDVAALADMLRKVSPAQS